MPFESANCQGPTLTAEEFEMNYASFVGDTVDSLHARGRVAERCSCDWQGCQGWVLGYQPSPSEAGWGAAMGAREDRPDAPRVNEHAE
jgi:hypothetical protein